MTSCRPRDSGPGRPFPLISVLLLAAALCSLRPAAAQADGALRLYGGNATSGRLEMYSTKVGAWGTVCDDNFSLVAAKVACLQLGLSVSNNDYYRTVEDANEFGTPTDDPTYHGIFFDSFTCEASEVRLIDCEHSGNTFPVQSDCDHSEDVVLTCRAAAPCTLYQSLDDSDFVDGSPDSFYAQASASCTGCQAACTRSATCYYFSWQGSTLQRVDNLTACNAAPVVPPAVSPAAPSPIPSPSPKVSPIASPSPIPSPSPKVSPVVSPSPIPSPSPNVSPILAPSPVLSRSPVPSPSPAPSSPSRSLPSPSPSPAYPSPIPSPSPRLSPIVSQSPLLFPSPSPAYPSPAVSPRALSPPAVLPSPITTTPPAHWGAVGICLFFETASSTTTLPIPASIGTNITCFLCFSACGDDDTCEYLSWNGARRVEWDDDVQKALICGYAPPSPPPPPVVPGTTDGQLRLAGGNATAGRLEIWSAKLGQWGTICGDDFGDYAAVVSCTQLGFANYGWSYNNVPSANYYGPPPTTTTSSNGGLYADGNGVFLDSFNCMGNETSLLQCLSPDDAFPTQTDCDHSNDVALQCRPIFQCPEVPGFTLTPNVDRPNDDIMCVPISGANASVTSPAQVAEQCQYDPECYAFNWDDINQQSCTKSGDYAFAEIEGICFYKKNWVSNGALRLVDGNQTSGRLEIYTRGTNGTLDSWGTVCGRTFSDAAAIVSCVNLGFSSVGASWRLAGNSYTGSVAFSDFTCDNVNETRLSNCEGTFPTPGTTCTHDQDVILSCTPLPVCPDVGGYKTYPGLDAPAANTQLSCTDVVDTATAALICDNDPACKAFVTENGSSQACMISVGQPTQKLQTTCFYSKIIPKDRTFRKAYGGSDPHVFVNLTAWSAQAQMYLPVCSYDFVDDFASFICRVQGYVPYGGDWISVDTPTTAVTMYDAGTTTFRPASDCVESVAMTCTPLPDCPPQWGYTIVPGFDQVGNNLPYGCYKDTNATLADLQCKAATFDSPVQTCAGFVINYENGTTCLKGAFDPALTGQRQSCVYERILHQDGDLRLVPDPSSQLTYGLLEIWSQEKGMWGTVCSDNFDDNAAAVACKQLGQGTRGSWQVVPSANYYGMPPDDGPTDGIFLDGFTCHGTESSLRACSATFPSTNNCAHSDDISLTCSS